MNLGNLFTLAEGSKLGKGLVYATVWSLFSEAIYVYYKVEIKASYLVVLFGLAMGLFVWDFVVNAYYACILAYVYVSGLTSILNGTNDFTGFIQQAVGISLCSLYFYILLRHSPFSLEGTFRIYARAAFWVCILGLGLTGVSSMISGTFVPVQSIMREPAHFATIVIPAVFYFLNNAIKRGEDIKEAFVTTSAVLLSVSAMAFLGLCLVGLLLVRHRRGAWLMAPAAALLIYGISYLTVDHFRIRVDDTLKSTQEAGVSEVNLSTYALLSNAYVAYSVISERPILGYGLGAHKLAHEKFINSLPGADVWTEYLETNATDADSLILRTTSELGIVGLCFIAVFLIRCYVPGESTYSDLSAALICYFALKLLRDGHWFSPEMYFFVWMYAMLWMEHRKSAKSSAPLLRSFSCTESFQTERDCS